MKKFEVGKGYIVKKSGWFADKSLMRLYVYEIKGDVILFEGSMSQGMFWAKKSDYIIVAED